MKGILVVSFGTSHDDTREKNIVAIENRVKELAIDTKVYSAFTSSIIIKILAKRNIFINDTKEALEKMHADGVRDLYIQPTHLLFGDEYSKLVDVTKTFFDKFDSIKIAKPLLATIKDCEVILKTLHDNIKKDDDTLLIVMGHGSEHYYNCVYDTMNFIALEQNMNVFITTVESNPTFLDAVKFAKTKGFKKAVLTPLMLVAGDHAVNDMASLDEEDSLATLLKNEGIEITSIIKGLGEYEAVQELYLKHLKLILN